MKNIKGVARVERKGREVNAVCLCFYFYGMLEQEGNWPLHFRDVKYMLEAVKCTGCVLKLVCMKAETKTFYFQVCQSSWFLFVCFGFAFL